MPSQENFVVHHLQPHGPQGQQGQSGPEASINGGASSLNPVVALLTRGGSSGGCNGASVSNTLVSSTTPTSSSSSATSASEENDDEGIGSSLADLDSLTDLLPMMAPDLVCVLLVLLFPFFVLTSMVLTMSCISLSGYLHQGRPRRQWAIRKHHVLHTTVNLGISLHISWKPRILHPQSTHQF